MNLYILAMALICVANLSLGVIVLLRSPRATSSRVFLAITIFVSLWAITNYITNQPVRSILLTDLTNRAAFVTGYAGVLCGLIFSYFFPERRQVSKLERRFVVALSVITLLASTTTQVAGAVERHAGKPTFTVGILTIPYIVSLLILFSLFVRNLVGNAGHGSSRSKSNAVRLQATFVVWGMGTTIVLAVVSNLLIPLIVTDWSSTRIAPFLSLVLVGSMSYAIIRHRLFDIRSYALRTLAYAFTAVTLSVVYVAPVILILAIGIMGFPFVPIKFVIGVVFGTIAAFYFDNLKNWFNQYTNKIFFRDAYDTSTVLSQLNRALVSTINLDDMLDASSAVINGAFKSEYSVFMLHHASSSVQRLRGTQNIRLSKTAGDYLYKAAISRPQKVIVTDTLDATEQAYADVLRKHDIAVTVRLSGDTVDHTADFGCLFIGYRRSGIGFGGRDVKTLETMADVLNLAIQNALRFEEIQNFNQTLQQQIEAATGKLRRTNAKLVALDESKDDFISMASHQLRTPLTAVKGYLSMVLENDAGEVTPLQRKMLGQAFTSSQRMVFLIADLLNVSRLKTGKFVIEPAPVDLSLLISQEIGQLRETASSQSLQLDYVKPKGFPKLQLDETKTRQVVMNFIDNALHYTPAGGHVRVELADLPHSVELRVVDDGIGVPKEEQRHLFTKFYRAANARRSRPDGTGLGLFMAKKVVVAQGGAIIFASREGKGSTFGFTLPKAGLLVV